MKNFSDTNLKTIILIPHEGRSMLPGISWEVQETYVADEMRRLAEGAGLEVVHVSSFRLKTPRASTLMGQGRVDELEPLIQELAVKLVVVDHVLSPVQQRNLERAWTCKVLDRTGLILNIFEARAQTAEGRLQVNLAQCLYQRSHLVRTWSHLERQRGGFGFLAGPGETQLEVDRRLLGQRIAKLKIELEKVKKTRALHRVARKRSHPVVALVGYTNAGKSTLFNRLTGARVRAEDRLFATLDPTMRRVMLPSGRLVILSDTVGFISRLPHELVAAFRATLEEVLEADLVLHVRDVACPLSDVQDVTVVDTLDDLFKGALSTPPMVACLNKMDLLSAEMRIQLTEQVRRHSPENPDLSRVYPENQEGFKNQNPSDRVRQEEHKKRGAPQEASGMGWPHKASGWSPYPRDQDTHVPSLYRGRDVRHVLLSAHTGEGIADLLALVDKTLDEKRMSSDPAPSDEA